MTRSLYTKPYLDPSELIAHMEKKGLLVPNRVLATQLLSDINYYRFKIYLVPFFDTKLNLYKINTSFTQGLCLYRFDDELRNFLFSIIGRIEVKLRTRLDQVITASTSNPFWYLDDNLFPDNITYQLQRNRASLVKLFDESKDPFVAHYKNNYFNNRTQKPEYTRLPPFWLLAELTTFGNIRYLYKNIKKDRFDGPQNTNDLDTLAHNFGAKNFATLNNWLDYIRDVRNRCAHHSRVWNSNYRAPRYLPSLLNKGLLATSNNRIYLFIVMLHQFENSLQIDMDVKNKIVALFKKYPQAETLKCSMGFPDGWDSDPFWT